jgi:D-ribose pyranose/furanose isomerase RbsD
MKKKQKWLALMTQDYQQKSAILAKRIKKKKIFVKRKLKGAYIRKGKNINSYSVTHA